MAIEYVCLLSWCCSFLHDVKGNWIFTVLFCLHLLQHVLECNVGIFTLRTATTTENLLIIIIYSSTIMKPMNRLVKRNLPPWLQWSKRLPFVSALGLFDCRTVVQIPQADTDSNYEDLEALMKCWHWPLLHLLWLHHALSVFAAILAMALANSELHATVGYFFRSVWCGWWENMVGLWPSQTFEGLNGVRAKPWVRGSMATFWITVTQPRSKRCPHLPMQPGPSNQNRFFV